jgi:enoyl-CoA hydratase
VPVDLERRGPVGLVTLNRPEALNALSPEMLDQLAARLDEVEADPGLRVVVLTGAGKAFCAGADIRHMGQAGPVEARAFAALGHRLADRIAGFPHPVICAVNGYALGGGCELALACDIRIASTAARMGQPEVNLGVLPGWGGTQRLARVTSPGMARELIYTARQVGAEEALRIGLVNAVHPPEALLDAALAMAGEIAERPAGAVSAAKEMLNLALGADMPAALARERDAFALAFATEDQKEGMAAFLERRPARFTGR